MAKMKPLSLYISLSLLLSLSSAFSPTDNFLINCGSPDPQTTDPNHRVFVSDESTRFLTSSHTIRLTDSNPSSSSPIYHTARAFNRPTHYAFPVKDCGTHHLVRFHFHRFDQNLNGHDDGFRCSEAQFHVIANGFLLLHDFIIQKGVNLPIIKEFVIPVDSEEIKITFLPSENSKFGFVNAIEVISAPKDLISDLGFYVGIGTTEKIDGLLKNGFETVHRVNVGGFKITPFNDSLWRTWVPDEGYYLELGHGSEKVHFGGRIMYRPGGASREVGPDNMYNSARIVKSLDNSVPNVNMMWRFEIEKGHKYLVRMHFCDIASLSLNLLYFNVYVNGNLAYENLDLSGITNGLLASPFYGDFVVDEVDSEALTLTVGPSNMSLPNAVDGILNGIEVMKMNNSMGSFGGKVCVGHVLRGWRRGNGVSGAASLIAAVCLLLAAVLVMQRKRFGFRVDNAAWTRIPTDVSEANVKA